MFFSISILNLKLNGIFGARIRIYEDRVFQSSKKSPTEN